MQSSNNMVETTQILQIESVQFILLVRLVKIQRFTNKVYTLHNIFT